MVGALGVEVGDGEVHPTVPPSIPNRMAMVIQIRFFTGIRALPFDRTLGQATYDLVLKDKVNCHDR